jgi:hypothetical protein
MKAISPINVRKQQVILDGTTREVIEVNQPVAATDSTTDGRWTLAPSPPLAMMEEHPKDAELIRRLQVLAEERS